LRTVRVRLGGKRSYEVRIGGDLLGQVGSWIRDSLPGERAVVISNPDVDRLYGDLVRRGLEKQGIQPVTLLVPVGEEQKSLDTAAKLYAGLQAARAERSTPVLALGGGVIGDLAGFVAATYMRGLPLVALPTTLLAQVDSSLGGKTAVDHGPVKNNIGVFHQPQLVMADTFTLRSLPQAEVSNGLAEVIKYGMISDRPFFNLLEKKMDGIRALEDELLEEVVQRCAYIKARIVEKDERDTGLRNILNFGHTIGHAIEAASDFRIGHGQAVAVGMVKASAISNRLGIFPSRDFARLKDLLLRAGLPVLMPPVDMSRVLRAIDHDKKVVNGKIRFILPQRIGRAFISSDVSFALAVEVLESDNG
jgi:3-dehydroquinate synthase